jgi:hypothetical protein
MFILINQFVADLYQIIGNSANSATRFLRCMKGALLKRGDLLRFTRDIGGGLNIFSWGQEQYMAVNLDQGLAWIKKGKFIDQ